MPMVRVSNGGTLEAVLLGSINPGSEGGGTIDCKHYADYANIDVNDIVLDVTGYNFPIATASGSNITYYKNYNPTTGILSIGGRGYLSVGGHSVRCSIGCRAIYIKGLHNAI